MSDQLEKRCSVEGCGRTHYGRGLCSAHYQRWRTGREVNGPIERKSRRPLAERLIAGIEVDEATGCWNWQGAKVYGYGYISSGAEKSMRQSRTHRVAYELLIGPIPEGLELDHLCRNRACCNPDHLEPVTHAVNAQRRPQQTHCVKGHELTPENVRVRKDRGTRECRICIRLWRKSK